MKKCPACAEELQDEALKCRFCGQILVGDGWRAFCERYSRLSEEQRALEILGLTEVQRATFEAAWQILAPEARKCPPRQSSLTKALVPDAMVGESHAKASQKRLVLLSLLAVIILATLFYILGRSAVEGTEKEFSSVRPITSFRKSALLSAEQARQRDVFYKQAQEALKRENYGFAAERLTRVAAIQNGYKDVDELLAKPEIRKARDEKARQRHIDPLPAEFARQHSSVRSGPSKESPVLREPTPGERLRYEVKRGNWYKLATLSGNQAWVQESEVTLAPRQTPPRVSPTTGATFTVVRKESFSAWVGDHFVPGTKVHVLATRTVDVLGVARKLAANERRPTTVFFWSARADIGKTASNHSVDCLRGPSSCNIVF